MAHGHDADCMCIPCMNEDFDNAVSALGLDPADYPAEVTTSERTRYARPGQACGTGVVRLVSERQVRFIKSLLASRDTSRLVRLPGSEDIERMSLAGARDLIDRLLACPERPRYVRPASDGQRAFIRSLCERKGMADLSGDVDSFERASATIDMLKALPDAPRPAVERPAPLAVGIYRHDDGRIVQVKPTRDGARMYGKLYDEDGHCWVYAPGLTRGLTSAHRLTLDECKDLSVELGSCCLCGRDLTATVDGVPPRERFIGPICAGKLS